MPNELHDDQHAQYVQKRRWEAVSRARLSALYHQKRERFYDSLDRASKALSAIGGAAAVSQLVLDPHAKLWIAAAVSFFATLSLVYGFSTVARRHSELARDYFGVLGELERSGAWPSEDVLNDIHAKISSLEAKEPAALTALVVHCENELSIANGHPERVVRIPRLQRVLMHFIAFNPNEATTQTGH